MNFCETSIPGCYEITPKVFSDHRGGLIKTFHRDLYKANGLQPVFAEEYYSISKKGVLRGLHFQLPPQDHIKLVYCISGSVFDVILDLRVGSPTYGKTASFELSAENRKILYVTKGMAHGFYALSDAATLMYKSDTVYSPEHDAGILWTSANIDWPNTNPIVSDKDKQQISFAEFDSPFVFNA